VWYTERLAVDIINHGTLTDNNGMMWVTDEWRTDPVGTRAPQSGYMQGAAGIIFIPIPLLPICAYDIIMIGIGSTMLGLDQALNGKSWSSVRIELPDSPANFGFFP
jgi:hypothetical protein